MSTVHTLNQCNNNSNMTLYPNSDENFECTAIRTTLEMDKKEIVLSEEQNDSDEVISIKGNFHAVLKPGEKVVIKKENIDNSNDVNFMKKYSQTSGEYATITNKETTLSFEENCENVNFDERFDTFDKEYEIALRNMEKMKIDTINKGNEIHKLKLDKQYMEGGIFMLKSNSIKLIPKSILTYIIIVSMAFCFFLTCFILDIFTNIYIIHPFISFISAFISLGLLITAFAAIKHIKSFCLKILSQNNGVQDGNN